MHVYGAGLWYCNSVIGLLVSGFLAGILNMSIWSMAAGLWSVVLAIWLLGYSTGYFLTAAA